MIQIMLANDISHPSYAPLRWTTEAHGREAAAPGLPAIPVTVEVGALPASVQRVR